MAQTYAEGTVVVGAYIPPTMKRELVEIALAERRTLSSEIRLALKNHIAAQQAQPRAHELAGSAS